MTNTMMTRSTMTKKNSRTSMMITMTTLAMTITKKRSVKKVA